MPSGEDLPGSHPPPPGDALLEERTQLFLVRLWDERGGAAPPEIRGVIEHLPSGKRRYFRELSAVVAFIAAYLPPPTRRARALRRLRSWWSG